MPKTTEELEKIAAEMRRLGSELRSTLDAQSEQTKAQLEAQRRQRDENIDQSLAQMDQATKERRNNFDTVILPANNLYIRLKTWTQLPDTLNAETVSQISDLIGRAQKDDQIAQQVLGETKKLVNGDKTIKTAGLPNLDWQPKVELPAKT